MTKRTRLFLIVAAGILVVGLGTGLVASYMGFQGLSVLGSSGRAELDYLPSDTTMLAYANVRDVMDSEFRDKLMQLKAGTNGAADRFQRETGIDVEKDVDHLVAAFARSAGSNAGAPPLVLVRGRFDEERIEGLARQHGGVVEEYKGRRLMTAGAMAISFFEPGLVAVGPPAAVRGALDVKAGGTSVNDNSELMAFVKQIEDGNVWAVSRFDAATGNRLPSEIANQIPPINWLAASGHVNGGVRGTLRAEAGTEEAARNLRDVVQGFVALARMQTAQHAELGALLNTLEITGQGKSVALSFSIPSELVDVLRGLHAQRPPVPPQAEPGSPAAPPPPAPPAL